jgi:hypothetical protein
MVGMEAVVHQELGDVLSGDAAAFLDAVVVHDALPKTIFAQGTYVTVPRD